MPPARSLAEYEAIRLAVLEAIIDRGQKLWRAAKEHRVQHYVARRWFTQHKSGEATLEALRAGESAIDAADLSRPTPPTISPLNPTEKLRRLIDGIRNEMREGQLNEGQLLLRTAPYVFHQDAPLDHFAAWLRFYVEHWG